MKTDSTYTIAGKIVRSHGTAGMVVFESEGIIPESGNLFLIEQSRGDLTPVRIEKATPGEKKGRPLFFLKFVDIDSRSESEKLKGLSLFENPGTHYSRKELPADDESGIDDLTGYAITDPESGFEGYVTDLVENPAHLLLEIQLGSNIILVPFVDAFILETDHVKKRITARNLAMFTDLWTDMLRIDLISAVPGLLENPVSHSIVKIAQEKGLLEIYIHNLRDYSADKHRKIDDYPYGGGAGMVITPQPVFDCIEKLTSERSYDEIIFTSPDGELFNQQQANTLSLKRNIIILCGHYKGVDQRIRDLLITREFSIGDVVLSGGELPALMVVDAVARLLPGVLGDAESALSDSFQDDLLEGPVYTRPAEFRGLKVPEVLTSGDHGKVNEWRKQQAIDKTRQLRPGLYKEYLKKNDDESSE